MSTDKSKLVDYSKPVMTRGGGRAVIHTTEGKDPGQPVVAEYQDSEGTWWLAKRALHGRYGSPSDHSSDIINVPQQHTVWVNVEPHTSSSGFVFFNYPTRAKADDGASEKRIACFEHTFFEGEGLNGCDE